jgi:HAD superfamily hydrolase (TIGR01490 family)
LIAAPMAEPETRNHKPGSLRAAYCDVDGTLAASNIVGPLMWYKRRFLSAPAHAFWLAGLCLRAPYWLCLDYFSREASNRAIYSQYAGLSVAGVRELAGECYNAVLKPSLFPQALAKLKALQKDGLRLVLVTGGLDFLTQPLAAELQAELIAPALEERDGCFTGRLQGPALTGAHKAEAVRAHAAARGIALAESCAFGDAIGDLALLECVGHPVAVNADGRLAALARQRGWQVENWK